MDYSTVATSRSTSVCGLHLRINQSVEIPLELAGQRTDRAAAQLFPEFSRSNLTRWLKEGGLTLDGAQVKANHKVVGGERLELDVEALEQESWDAPQQVDFQVLFEDEHLLVVNKPVASPAWVSRPPTMLVV